MLCGIISMLTHTMYIVFTRAEGLVNSGADQRIGGIREITCV